MVVYCGNSKHSRSNSVATASIVDLSSPVYYGDRQARTLLKEERKLNAVLYLS